jgi:hypothetical protein
MLVKDQKTRASSAKLQDNLVALEEMTLKAQITNKVKHFNFKLEKNFIKILKIAHKSSHCND